MENPPAAVGASAHGNQSAQRSNDTRRRRRRHRHISGSEAGRVEQDANNNAAVPVSTSLVAAPLLQAPANTSPNRPPTLFSQHNQPPRQTIPNAPRLGRGSFSANPGNSRSGPHRCDVPNRRAQGPTVNLQSYEGSAAIGYFVTGRVFKRATSAPAGRGFDPETNTDPHFNWTVCGWMYTKFIYFVVVGVTTQCCYCFPINTYKGQGLAKKTLTDAEAQDHTVIYSSGHPIPPDSRTTREPIKVNTREPLDPMSRLNLQKVHTVEMNQGIIDVGMVTPTSLPSLIAYACAFKLQPDQPAGNVGAGSADDVGAPLNVEAANNFDAAGKAYSSMGIR